MWPASKAMQENYAGSELIMLWFAERDLERGLVAIVEPACRNISWESFAKDFDYCGL
jgi:hypothetical protein